MTYHFKWGEESVEESLRKVAISQIEKAVTEIDEADIDKQETVHQVRKRAKKLRGLIRLVRPSLAPYKRENACFRDAAAELSYSRDAEAKIETFDELISRYDGHIEAGSFESLRQRLVSRRAELTRREELDKKLENFRKTMVAARERVAEWVLDDCGYDSVAGGLSKTYKRARKAMSAAREEPTPEKLHEWRKRVKYHWYHARLLREIWPDMMETHVDAADRLSDFLGDHHDLAVLRRTLVADADDFGDAAELEAFMGLIGARQAVLEQEAFTLGHRLLAEKTSALVSRWNAYWCCAVQELSWPKRTLAA